MTNDRLQQIEGVNAARRARGDPQDVREELCAEVRWLREHLRYFEGIVRELEAANHKLVNDGAKIIAAWENRVRELEEVVQFWRDQFERARCGCVQRDCSYHGAWAAEDLARIAEAKRRAGLL